MLHYGFKRRTGTRRDSVKMTAAAEMTAITVSETKATGKFFKTRAP